MAKINLADAIADAKNLRETAITNARIQLEETFTPTLQRMVSTRIHEEEGEEDVDIDLNIGDEGEEGGMGFDSFDSEEPVEDEAPVEEGDEDMELESLMRELDGEDDDMAMEGDEFEDDEMMEGEEDEYMSTNPGAEEDQFTEGEDYDEEELEEALQAVMEMDGLGDDLDMGPNKEDGSVFDENPPSGPQFLERRKLRNEIKRLQNENRKLKKNLNESLKVNVTFKKTINEVNLLNAKLMYFTKTQRKFNLTESQENRILNSFDRANSVREVKLVFTTVCESFNKKPVRVNEGYASKPTQSVKPQRDIVSENLVTRMQRLANIRPLND